MEDADHISPEENRRIKYICICSTWMTTWIKKKMEKVQNKGPSYRTKNTFYLFICLCYLLSTFLTMAQGKLHRGPFHITIINWILFVVGLILSTVIQAWGVSYTEFPSVNEPSLKCFGHSKQCCFFLPFLLSYHFWTKKKVLMWCYISLALKCSK